MKNSNLDQFHQIEQVIKARRTNLRIDHNASVPTDLLEHLCELACWAPNHKMTAPWIFTLLQGEARRELGKFAVDDLIAKGISDEARLAKTSTKYLRAPVIVVVGSKADPDPVTHVENRDAVAAGIQNFLLAATTAGLATYWGTSDLVQNLAVKKFCGLQPADQIVGIIYIGWPTGVPNPPPRKQPRIIYKG